MNERLAIRWHPREPPLEPVGAVARGQPAREMAQRLLSRTDDALARLRIAGGEDLLAVLGPAEDLPWVDGITYLGRDALAPALVVPTLLQPEIHPALVERAVLQRGGGGGPWAVLLDPPRLVNLGMARAVDRTALTAWMQGRP